MSAKGERLCDRVVELFLNGHMTWSEAKATLQTYGADDRFIADSIGETDPDQKATKCATNKKS